MNKEKLMKLRDGGITIIMIILALGAIGWASAKVMNEPDSIIEEAAESALEEQLEELLGLEEGVLDGTIDFSLSSPEA